MGDGKLRRRLFLAAIFGFLGIGSAIKSSIVVDNIQPTKLEGYPLFYSVQDDRVRDYHVIEMPFNEVGDGES